jgi:alkylation response protein AidB-like acyl-CoA dehydrogenase
MATVATAQARSKEYSPPPINGDFYKIADVLDPKERAVVKRVRDFMEIEVAPIIEDYWGRDQFPHEIIPKLRAVRPGQRLRRREGQSRLFGRKDQDQDRAAGRAERAHHSEGLSRTRGQPSAKRQYVQGLGKVLRMTRTGVAWFAVGCQMGAYEHALRYAHERVQFGRPIGGFQLVQDLLVRMLGNVTSCQALMLRRSYRIKARCRTSMRR